MKNTTSPASTCLTRASRVAAGKDVLALATKQFLDLVQLMPQGVSHPRLPQGIGWRRRKLGVEMASNLVQVEWFDKLGHLGHQSPREWTPGSGFRSCSGGSLRARAS